ncbi:MAG: hypothetical protein UW46_C0007G0018 [Candidatus Yanofskybacteria bacterium GW2011_GWF1_44_227]|uniref:Uncharacterized protein n=1 Tax=Candidatus Yanofskybacteria bacterium GW2011_GWE2_40_11 TaxID=1619033 RepID=A0A0G0QHY9_9BACT|nr:MAG: hypothetical protein UT75_C0011G0017 [Candidatus Yanofskybacteria bacterium GW2011_GWE2_40_11]KKT15358.1 MAG: hypothetical protein UV97_C0008G0007 [Candidatus Yanofskybacteria bacterium GW2011_GWF2_43_596]KKT53042.1 MAG: hypothetical protein UW46_C0007G0018 [Candidatus Yanofskybacteria bacterium GW2011_GWF1_44_227]OGN35725.1 MAG: hypothetical protein A2241_02470 [Candidatus Yanofskybacteria bacterium RIFOXYA2_FULL_45_28]OGN35763.1 MAG: hypothetical protein A2207_01685 [Candidatus Yanofs
MEAKEVVRRIIAGSRTIDAMRDEIDLVVKTVLGLTGSTELINAAVQYHDKIFFSDGNASWHLFFKKGWPSQIVVEFILGKTRVIYSSYEYDGLTIPMAYVERVYEMLTLFVAEMVKMFPHLEERLSPLLKAADRA